jgi:hypothetical protein
MMQCSVRYRCQRIQTQKGLSHSRLAFSTLLECSASQLFIAGLARVLPQQDKWYCIWNEKLIQAIHVHQPLCNIKVEGLKQAEQLLLVSTDCIHIMSLPPRTESLSCYRQYSITVHDRQESHLRIVYHAETSRTGRLLSCG